MSDYARINLDGTEYGEEPEIRGFDNRLFAIRDSKANAFHFPFKARNAAVALRMVYDAASDTSTDMYKYAGDYAVFELGVWNEDRGCMYMLQQPINHGLVIDIINPED